MNQSNKYFSIVLLGIIIMSLVFSVIPPVDTSAKRTSAIDRDTLIKIAEYNNRLIKENNKLLSK